MKLHNKQTNTLLKKTTSLLLSILLLLPICGAASYVGLCNSVSITADREVRAGYSYNVRLVMDSVATGYEGYFTYDSSVLTLSRIVPVNSELYTDFQVKTENGYVRVTHSAAVRQMLQLTFYVREDAKPNTTATVRFYSGSAINGSSTESVADTSFRFTVVDKKSSDASLQALEVSVFRTQADRDKGENGFIASPAPSFSPSRLTYSMTVANDFAFFKVSAATTDPAAKIVSETSGELADGVVNTFNITVRAEDGTQNIYVLQIFRERLAEVSTEPSAPESDTTTEEVSDDSSEESSELTSSDFSSDESDDSEEPSESSDVTSEETDDVTASAGEESRDETSSAESKLDITSTSSILSSPTSSVLSSDPSNDKNNLSGLFFGIAVASALFIVVLLIRILFIIRKKRKNI